MIPVAAGVRVWLASGVTDMRKGMNGVSLLVQEGQVAHAARAHAALEPAPADAPGLADPGLIEEPDLEPLGLGMVAAIRFDQRREFFFEARLGLAIGFDLLGYASLAFRAEAERTGMSSVLPRLDRMLNAD
jgi:hypothetical protein